MSLHHIHIFLGVNKITSCSRHTLRHHTGEYAIQAVQRIDQELNQIESMPQYLNAQPYKVRTVLSHRH